MRSKKADFSWFLNDKKASFLFFLCYIPRTLSTLTEALAGRLRNLWYNFISSKKFDSFAILFSRFVCVGYVEKWTLHRIIHSFSQSFLSNITLRAPRMIKCHSWSFEVEENTIWPLLSAYQWAGEFFAWKICFFSHHLVRGFDQN